MKFGLADSIVEGIQRVLETNPKIDKAIIFGSRAKGNYKEGSDIDIALKGEELKLDDLLTLEVKLDDLDLPYSIDLVNYVDIREPALTEHIDRAGIEFYSRWKEYKLDEVFEFASGLSKSADQFGYGYGFLSFTDIFDNYFVPDELTSLVNSTDKEQERSSIRRGDIFLTRTSETDEDLGMSCVALKNYPKATFNGFTKRLRTNEKIDIFPEYAGFYFRSPKFRASVSSMSSVTTRASLNNGMLSQLKLIVPPLSDQKSIAETLISLHDKIALLHRQNKTLESMAEAIFRQWFIEDKDADWEETTLEMHVSINRGLSYKGNGLTNENLGIPMHNLNSIYEGGGYKYEGIKYYNGDHKDRHLVYPGDIIVANTEQGHEHRLIGFPAIVPDYFGPKGLFSQHIYKLSLSPESYLPKEFIYYLIMTPSIREQIIGATNGSTVNMLALDGLQKAAFKLPSEEKVKKFSKIINDYWLKTNSNYHNIKVLIDLRDTLLPKLLSGEARVKMP